MAKSVFGGESYEEHGAGDPATGSVNQPSTGGAAGGVTQPAGSSLLLKTVCGFTAVNDLGTSVTAAASLQLVVKDPAGATVCTLTTGIKENIVKSRSLDLAACSLKDNAYTAQLFDPAKPGKDLFFAVSTARQVFMQDDSISLTRASAGAAWTVKHNISDIQEGISLGGAGLYASVLTELGVLWGSNPAIDHAVNAADCTATASPLVVDMTPEGQENKGLQLSSPSQGVLFDILGRNSNPFPHAKKRISWIQNPSYMLVALPRHNRVDGVDQLFGNNTYGPDAAFADDGFAALAKHDANHDGVIDAQDPVFTQLRLWSDKNRDGVSRPDELHSLSQMQIKKIDLVYDPTFFEQDQYGNQSRLRSTVESESGKLHMIFDLWFALH